LIRGSDCFMSCLPAWPNVRIMFMVRHIKDKKKTENNNDPEQHHCIRQLTTGNGTLRIQSQMGLWPRRTTGQSATSSLAGCPLHAVAFTALSLIKWN